MPKALLFVLTVVFLAGCSVTPDTVKSDRVLHNQFKNHPRYPQYMKMVKSIRHIQAPELPSADGYIGKGKVWQTPYYLKDSGVAGPTVFILGGTHGYELAGWFAAQELLHVKPDRGRLYVIPRVNYRGVQLKHRFVPGERDLNRCYPGNPDGGNTERLAFDVFEFIKSKKAEIVFDLHESFDYHLVDEESLGQSIIFYTNDKAAWVSLMVSEAINEQIAEPLEKVSILHGPKVGSTAWAAGKYLGIQGYTLETAIPLPLKKRIDYHLRLVRLIFKENGINLTDERI